MLLKKQITASIVSTNRQDWINKLREELANYLRDIRFISAAFSKEVLDAKQTWGRIENMSLTIERIKLYLNPNEVEHSELIRLLHSGYNKVINGLKKKNMKLMK